MKKVNVALVEGDGAAPEMMAWATRIAQDAALKDDIAISFVLTPMGWNTYQDRGDTFPAQSFRTATEIGTLFFGGVGDPKLENTIGKEHPEMRPEARTLLAIRKQWGLLLNFRPMVYYKALAHLANVKPENIPDAGVRQIWIRFLLEDSYFGNADMLGRFTSKDPGYYVVRGMGMKHKQEVDGSEKVVADLAYYNRATIEQYIRAAFACARVEGLPLISIDKANIMARYDFWRRIVTKIGKEEFPDVPLSHQLVDSANALLFTPAKLHGVIACGNEHGGILSDGAAAALGSMGMMCSSAINPNNGMAMFESGAGTAPTLAGQDKANPLGRILTAAMMLRHLGALKGAAAIEAAVKRTLQDGYRTADIAQASDYPDQILGTKMMGAAVHARL